MIVTAGSTNRSVYFYIVGDASHASPGDPITGLLFSDIETGGSASYARQGAARVDLTLITLASASAAHSDGGFIEVDATNMPGVYRCDYPDAAFVTGVDQVICHLVAAASNNSAIAPILVDITDVDLRDSVRGGMTALPNAAADAAGGLPVSDAGGLDLDARLDELASANMPADLDTIIANLATVDTEVGGIQTDLNNGTDGLGALKALIEAVMTTQMTESYAADGVAPTPAQALFFIQQLLSDFSISGVTLTGKKLDGTTPAFTLTLNDGTGPTGVTRAS